MVAFCYSSGILPPGYCNRNGLWPVHERDQGTAGLVPAGGPVRQRR
jgi:hypothetical protein